MRTKESTRRVPWNGRLNEKSTIKYQRASKVARKTAPIQQPIYMEIDLDSDDEDNQSTQAIIISTDSDSDEEYKPSYKELREENLRLLYGQRKVQKEYDEEKQRRKKVQKECDKEKQRRRKVQKENNELKEKLIKAQEENEEENESWDLRYNCCFDELWDLRKAFREKHMEKYLKRFMSLIDENTDNIRGGDYLEMCATIKKMWNITVDAD